MNWGKVIQKGLLIGLGSGIFAFGLVFVNMPNHLAQGGVTGLALILNTLWGINPAYSTLALNIPILVFGGRLLGKQSLLYTIMGTLMLSGWLYVWQQFLIRIDLEQDLLLAALVAGLLAGLGSGIIYKVGGTTGGGDVLARILEKRGIAVSRSLFLLDVVVLTASLSYLTLKPLLYTVIFSFVFTRIMDYILTGGYRAKGILIISRNAEVLAEELMSKLQRGVSFIEGIGGYSHEAKKIIYMVVNPRELAAVKAILQEVDREAFVSVLNVHEVAGAGFTFQQKPTGVLAKALKNGI